MESTGMEPSFLKASFKSALLLIVGSLYSPSAATKIVTCCHKNQHMVISKACLHSHLSNCLLYKHLHTKKPHNLLPEVWLVWKHFLTTMYSLLNRSALGAAIIRLRKLFTFTNVSSSNLPLSSNDSWLKRSSPLLMERLISDCKYRRYDKEAHPKSNAAGLYTWRTDHLRGS